MNKSKSNVLGSFVARLNYLLPQLQWIQKILSWKITPARSNFKKQFRQIWPSITVTIMLFETAVSSQSMGVELAEIGPCSICCNDKGILQLRIALGRIGKASDNSPLELVFEADKYGGLILPSQWRIPLVESHAFKTDEESCTLRLPDGRDFNFTSLNPSKNEDESAPKISGNEITFRPDGVNYSFTKGRLKSITSKERQLRFRYNSTGLIQSISDELERSLLTCKKLSGGFNRKISIQLPKQEASSEQSYVIDAISSPVQSGVGIEEPISMRIEASGERAYVLDISKSTDQTGSSLEVKFTSGGTNKTTSVGWGNSGHITNVNDLRVTCIDRYGSEKSGWPCILVTGPDGHSRVAQNGYSDAERNSLKTFNFTDSDTVENFFVATPNGTKIRKTLKNGVFVYQAFYDKAGNLLRERGQEQPGASGNP